MIVLVFILKYATMKISSLSHSQASGVTKRHQTNKHGLLIILNDVSFGSFSDMSIVEKRLSVYFLNFDLLIILHKTIIIN